MKNDKKLIVGFGCSNGQAVHLDDPTICYSENILDFMCYFGNSGADELFIFDLSETDDDHEKNIGLIKEIARTADIPIITGGRVKRLEDVKKYLYAGAKAVFLDASVDENVDMMREAANRFGDDKIYAYLPNVSYIGHIEEYNQLGASAIIIKSDVLTEKLVDIVVNLEITCFLTGDCKNPKDTVSLLSPVNVGGIIAIGLDGAANCMEIKHQLKNLGIAMDTFESAIAWKDFKKNSDDMIPVIVQDYRTLEVLMLAYMNEEAFEATLQRGRMTYFSRSRKELWLKGETSGHFQYVKSLSLDCDNDTLLAKVNQVGAACHTGAHSCFFQTLMKKEYPQTNPLKVFEDVFQVILDRKVNPKEGSYTTYLFDKGIDKILKKLGEEATEIVIAAKNPDAEEVKYEISDFLYHMMVLMAEKGVTWEDITRELANR